MARKPQTLLTAHEKAVSRVYRLPAMVTRSGYTSYDAGRGFSLPVESGSFSKPLFELSPCLWSKSHAFSQASLSQTRNVMLSTVRRKMDSVEMVVADHPLGSRWSATESKGIGVLVW